MVMLSAMFGISAEVCSSVGPIGGRTKPPDRVMVRVRFGLTIWVRVTVWVKVTVRVMVTVRVRVTTRVTVQG